MPTGTRLVKFTPSTRALRPLDVQVYIAQIQCVALSQENGPNNDRSEIYILFSGKSPAGRACGRLPRCVADDSYFEYWVGKVNDNDADWTNHDQAPVGRPVVWTGTLQAGEYAEFVVAVIEQDNQDIGTVEQMLKAAFNAADTLPGSNMTANAIITAARGLAEELPESKGHDIIGAFAIQVANVEGQLQTTFVPIQGEMAPAGSDNPANGIAERERGQAALFDCMGTDNRRYRVIPTARIGAHLPIRTYIGKEIDRCGEALLAVEGGPNRYNGFYHVGKGKAAWVPIALPRFAWYCQTTKQWTTAPKSTNLVHVHRSGTDREITWYCYNEEVQGCRPAYKPTRTWVKLSTEIDQCGEGLLVVEGAGGFYHLAPGQHKWVPITNRQFDWYCDTTHERAIAPEETNLIRATRSAQNHQITWEYCREIVSLQPYTTPDDTKYSQSQVGS